MPRRHLENWRVKVVHSPAMIERLLDGHHEVRDADGWQATADVFNSGNWFYAFERSPDEVRAVVHELWADQAPAALSDAEAAATARAVAYLDSPDQPVGVGFLSHDKCATTYLAPVLAAESQTSCRSALLRKLDAAVARSEPQQRVDR